MEEEGKGFSRKSVKRPKSSETESEDEEIYVSDRRSNGEVNDRTVYCCKKTPYFGETSINNILKVVSLQSFSNSRLAMNSSGSSRHETVDSREKIQRDTVITSAPANAKVVKAEQASSPETEGVEKRINGDCNYTPNLLFNNKNLSRGKKGEKHINYSKDGKYWEKRERNNASAKRSRDARRVRELECQIRADFLEEENHKYSVENEMLREENKRLLKIIEDFKKAKE